MMGIAICKIFGEKAQNSPVGQKNLQICRNYKRGGSTARWCLQSAKGDGGAMRQIGATRETGKRNKLFFSAPPAVFLAVGAGVAGICRVLTVYAPEKRIAPCSGGAIAPNNGMPFCIQE